MDASTMSSFLNASPSQTQTSRPAHKGCHSHTPVTVHTDVLTGLSSFPGLFGFFSLYLFQAICHMLGQISEEERIQSFSVSFPNFVHREHNYEVLL